MISLRCKKILSICYVVFTFITLLLCLSFDTGNEQNEFTDILLILSFISLPISIVLTIYYCGIMNNPNSIFDEYTYD